MNVPSKVLTALDDGLPGSLERLFDLLRVPSISTDPAYADSCEQAAQWLAKDLESIGFDATVRATTGRPMVVAHHPGPEASSPHVLFYGHYDVQPVDPLELWESHPFKPELKEVGGHQTITGRGAADDKGQLMTFIEACRAYKKVEGNLPLRVTILLEGEEESGSASLEPFLKENAEELKADFALICDTFMWDEETPAITVALRGLVAEEITVKAANRDLHSGSYGGAAANPLRVLSKILGDLHDAESRVAIPGFYEGVEETPPEILKIWNGLTGRPEKLLSDVGLAIPSGENGRSVLELTWARPTAEINGICGGYAGAGFKTVIPAEASAKVSFRLVHEQDPDRIRDAFRAFAQERVPDDCTVEFGEHGSSPATYLGYDSQILKVAREALDIEWPKKTLLIAEGGTLPIVGDFQRLLGMDVLMIGFALMEDRLHSPNEKYALSSFHKGQRSWARILAALANARATGQL